ncbi:hypothetical protein LINGRAHAP2_LOCUS19530 [Linum grandiflorum]
MFDLKLFGSHENEAIMSKLSRSCKSRDEFYYEEDPVLCHCGVRASRRISHTAQNLNHKFFGCANYESQGDKGCSYFDWFDVKVATVTEKLKTANLVESLKNEVHDLRVENKELQAELARAAPKLISLTTSESSSCNNNGNVDYVTKSEFEALKRRVHLFERRA